MYEAIQHYSPPTNFCASYLPGTRACIIDIRLSVFSDPYLLTAKVSYIISMVPQSVCLANLYKTVLFSGLQTF